MRVTMNFIETLATKKRGESFVYHEGLLMRDRQMPNSGGVAMRGAAAWAAMEKGLCTLVQKRIDKGTCQYIAVAR